MKQPRGRAGPTAAEPLEVGKLTRYANARIVSANRFDRLTHRLLGWGRGGIASDQGQLPIVPRKPQARLDQIERSLELLQAAYVVEP